MSIYYAAGAVTLHAGDCLDVLRELPDASVDAVVTDPPYGLSNTSPQQVADTLVRWVNGDRDYLPGGKGFMGKAWDAFVPPVAVWDECFRVLKPGGHLLTFAGTRTMDLMGLGVRLAGFEIRDSVAWMSGSGFPKSLDVSKAIDKAAGAERRPILVPTKPGNLPEQAGDLALGATGMTDISAPATPEAERWQGWGTALKPAFEPVVVARKPLQGTVAANVLAHGTGALNIGACRVEGGTRPLIVKTGEKSPGSSFDTAHSRQDPAGTTAGRWPANVVLDESQAADLDEQSGEGVSKAASRGLQTSGQAGGLAGAEPNYRDGTDTVRGHNDSGGASRFFYVAKADASERVRVDGIAHPTVKPLALMRWLVRLVTPPGGTVLEPFAGSGTTVEACLLEGFRCIAIEREADYLPLIVQRINRRRDPVAAVKATGDDGGLFDLLDGGAA